jgi:hypothetical protein
LSGLRGHHLLEQQFDQAAEEANAHYVLRTSDGSNDPRPSAGKQMTASSTFWRLIDHRSLGWEVEEAIVARKDSVRTLFSVSVRHGSTFPQKRVARAHRS